MTTQWRDRIGIVLSIVLTYIIFVPFAVTNCDVHHDGVVLIPAMDVLNGKVLYRDSYTAYGPLTVYIHALALRIAGGSVITLRLLTVFLYAWTSAFLWLIWRSFLPPAWTALSVLLWIASAHIYTMIFHSWPTVPAILFQTAAIYFLTRKSFTGTTLFLAGIMTACSYWSKQPIGGLLFFAVTVACILLWLLGKWSFGKTIRVLGWYWFGFFVIGILILTYFWVNGALTGWWKQSIVLAPQFAAVIRGVSITQVGKAIFLTRYWKEIGAYWFWLAVPFAVVWLSVRVLFGLIRSDRTIDDRWLIVYAALLSSWLQYYPANDPGHAFWAATPMIGFFVLMGKEMMQKIIRNKNVLFRVTLILVLGVFAYRFVSGLQRIKSATYSLDYPGIVRGLRLTIEEKIQIERTYGILSRYFSEHPDKTYIAPVHNPLYVLFDRHYRSFHILPMRWEFVNDVIYPDYDEKMYSYIETYRPLVITQKKQSVSMNIVCIHTLKSDGKGYISIFLSKAIIVRIIFSLCP